MTEGAYSDKGRTQESVNEEYCRWLRDMIDTIEAGEYNVSDWAYSEKTGGAYDPFTRHTVCNEHTRYTTLVDIKFQLVSTGKAYT